MRLKPKKGEGQPPAAVEPSQGMNPEDAVRKPPPRPAAKPAPRPQPGEPVRRPNPVERQPLSLGKSVHIKGELNGDEDVSLDGALEGKIVLTGNLTIGSNGRINAEVRAKSVTILGCVVGNIFASDKIDLRPGGSVEGDLCAPRVVLGEGARFKGSVDMQSQVGGPAGSEGWPQTPQSAIPGETDELFGNEAARGLHSAAPAQPKGGVDPSKGLEDIFD